MTTIIHPDLPTGPRSAAFTIDTLLQLLREGWFPYRTHEGAFAWCRNDVRAVIMLNEASSTKAKKILRPLPDFAFAENENTNVVIEALSNPRIKPNTWIGSEVLHIYQILNGHGYLRCVEAYRESKLAGAALLIDLGNVVVVETMLTLASNGSKAALCYAVNKFFKLGRVCLDVQSVHPPAHPAARLGESVIDMDQYLRLLNQ
jgi:leucyl/phenylalanyl-tRNA--protein transferase